MIEHVQMIRISAEKTVKIEYENEVYYVIIKMYYVLCDEKAV